MPEPEPLEFDDSVLIPIEIADISELTQTNIEEVEEPDVTTDPEQEISDQQDPELAPQPPSAEELSAPPPPPPPPPRPEPPEIVPPEIAPPEIAQPEPEPEIAQPVPEPVPVAEPTPEPTPEPSLDPEPQVASVPAVPRPVSKPTPPPQAQPEPTPESTSEPTPEADDQRDLEDVLTDVAEQPDKPQLPSAFASVLENAANAKARRAEQAPILTISEQDALRRQIAGCWNPPAGARDAQNMVVEIEIGVYPDRTLRYAKLTDSYLRRLNQDSFFRAMAESAIRALRNPRCSPLMLPADKYQSWKEIQFTFNPSEMFRYE